MKLLSAFIMTVATLAAQIPTITAVINESGSKSLSPGGIAVVQGANLGTTATKVTVGSRQAYVFNGGGTSLQFEIPVDAPLGATTLTAGASAPFSITLVQYSPGIPTNNNVTQAYHYLSQQPMTAAFPASPNEQIAVAATGLGPTNPVFPTGMSPNDTSAVTVTLPTVSLQGKPATVSSAFLEPGSPGFYLVVFTVPASVTTGTQSLIVSIGGLSSETTGLPVCYRAGHRVRDECRQLHRSDAAQWRNRARVHRGDQRGQPGTYDLIGCFECVSKHDTKRNVGGDHDRRNHGGGADVLHIFHEVAFLLPSNTPVGTGTITATYNGQAGPAAPITVVTSNLGIFTATSDGQGVGIVTNGDYSLVSVTKAANCGGVYTTCGAANPGDTLVLWATGLGPVSGSDSAGVGLGVNIPNLPLTLWLGGVPAQVTYQGRSGCCIGEDQIVFVVPANVPTGCAVPLAVQIGNEVSNYAVVPVAPSGTRTCTPSNSTFTGNLVQQITTSSGAITHGEINISRQPNINAQGQVSGNLDFGKAVFFSFTVPAALQPFIVSYIDDSPAGTCAVYNNLNGGQGNYLANLSPLDAGPSIKVTGPNGSQTIPTNGAGQVTLASGTFLSPGAYTFTGAGGADIGSFTAPFTISAPPTLTSPASGPTVPVTRANGITVTWSGGAANSVIQIQGQNATDNSGTIGANFICFAAASAGTFTIPPSVLLALPPGSFGGLELRAYTAYSTFTASGLNHDDITMFYATPIFTTFK